MLMTKKGRAVSIIRRDVTTERYARFQSLLPPLLLSMVQLSPGTSPSVLASREQDR